MELMETMEYLESCNMPPTQIKLGLLQTLDNTRYKPLAGAYRSNVLIDPQQNKQSFH